MGWKSAPVDWSW
jgi:hypothetical protein